MAHFSVVRVTSQRCKVTLVQALDSGGWIPTSVVTVKLPEVLDAVGSIKKIFTKDEYYDKLDRMKFVKIVKEDKEEYSKYENGIVKDMQEKFLSFEKLLPHREATLNITTLRDTARGSTPAPENGKSSFLGWLMSRFKKKSLPHGDLAEEFREVDTFDHRVRSHFAPIKSLDGSIIWGQVVVDANFEEALAYVYSLNSRCRSRDADDSELVRSFRDRNSHSAIYRSVRNLGRLVKLREWIEILVWKKIDDENIVIASDNFDDPEYPVDNSLLKRASGKGLVQLTKLQSDGGSPQTLVTLWVEHKIGFRGELGMQFFMKTLRSLPSRHPSHHSHIHSAHRLPLTRSAQTSLVSPIDFLRKVSFGNASNLRPVSRNQHGRPRGRGGSNQDRSKQAFRTYGKCQCFHPLLQRRGTCDRDGIGSAFAPTTERLFRNR